MHERYVGLATAGQGQGLPRADGDGLDGQAGLFLEHGHEEIEQPRVLGARGGGQDDVGGLRASGRREPSRAQQYEQQAKQHETSLSDRYYASVSILWRRTMPRVKSLDPFSASYADQRSAGSPPGTSESERRRLPDHDERRRHRADDGPLGLRAARADEVSIRRRSDVLPAHGAAASVTASSGAALALRAWGHSDPEPQRIHHATV